MIAIGPRLRLLAGVVLCGVVGAAVAVLLYRLISQRSGWDAEAGLLPYPHVVPKSEGGVALRFAMVHDVIHERFPRHCPEYYAERNRRAREELATLGTQPPRDPQARQRYFALLDDLAVGLEFVGEHDEAIRLMRDKLSQQRALGLSAKERYSTYANLGTFLILGPFREVHPGREEDMRLLREGLDDIRTAVQINPESHFGREVWQIALIEYMLALHDNPELLLRYDMIGDRLEADLASLPRHPLQNHDRYTGGIGEPRGVLNANLALIYLQDPQRCSDCRRRARAAITCVGADEGWTQAVNSSCREPVAFDEPTLGIIGMWRLGGGAHPYFALALGEIMLRVGQDYIAWAAFERAARLSGIAWPDDALQRRFAGHCRSRQGAIEAVLPQSDVPRLRPAFEAELDRGLSYQKDYRRYEEQRIAAGASLDDPHFYDDFDAGHGPIASDVGHADWFLARDTFQPPWDLVLAALGAGVFALAAAIFLPFRTPARAGG